MRRPPPPPPDPLEDIRILLSGFAALKVRIVERMIALDAEREKLIVALREVEDMQGKP